MAKDIVKHQLIPIHTKLSDKEKAAMFKKFKVTARELPMIIEDDPAIQHLETQPGDVLKIERNSSTAGKALFYRVVVSR